METQDQNYEQKQYAQGIEDQQIPGDPSETGDVEQSEAGIESTDDEEAVGSDADYSSQDNLETTLNGSGDDDLDSDPGNDEQDAEEAEIIPDDDLDDEDDLNDADPEDADIRQSDPGNEIPGSDADTDHGGAPNPANGGGDDPDDEDLIEEESV